MLLNIMKEFLFVKKLFREYSLDIVVLVAVPVVVPPLVLTHGIALMVVRGLVVVVTGLLGAEHELPEIHSDVRSTRFTE